MLNKTPSTEVNARFDGSTSIDTRLLQCPKTLLSIVTSLSCINTFFKELQLLKAALPKVLQETGILISVSDSQPTKANSPMELTSFGILIEASDSQLENNPFSIFWVEEGSITSRKLVHLLKTFFPKDVTDSGNLILERLIHPKKA